MADADPMIETRRLVALALTAAGALPFLAAAILTLLFDGSYQGWIAEEIATLYGAVILSFLGGVRWGAGLARGPVEALPFSVLPSLAGFFSLFMDVRSALIVLTGAFALQMIWDAVSGSVLPEWFIRLRLAITIVVILCLAITLYGTY
ncbi:MAG: DUF3429 domain-containing protein [Rhizobiaceae bacterium]|jgi:hypothetical protein|nr:DUF3429 domain-containing protein [Rhizobiaceae bacterium]